MLKFKYKCILLILTIFTAFYLIFNGISTLRANAQTYITNDTDNLNKLGFYRIINNDTIFYSDSNGENPLFYLPYTYYVKVLSSGQIFSHVECYGNDFTALLDGYVETDKLFCDNLSVTAPYLNLKIVTANACPLYLDNSTSDVYQYLFESRTCQYYGSFTSLSGENIFYVSYNNKLGYVKESDIIPFTIENHPNPLTFIIEQPTTPEINNESGGENLTVLRISIIVCILFAGLIALVYIIKTKPKKEVAASYYDDNDFE